MKLCFVICLTAFCDCYRLSETRNVANNLVHIPKGAYEENLTTVYLGYANNPFGPSKPVTQNYSGFVSNNSKTTLKQIKFGHSVYIGHRLNEYRTKRGVIHLYNMVSCSTGCDPLIYKGYGCYCGFLGEGRPIDGIDRCCKLHDWCYDSSNCFAFLEYFVPYYWKCYNNRPLCAIEHGEWGGVGSCAQRLCECDKALSKCLKKYPCPSSRALCRSSPWRLIQNAALVFF